MLGFFSLSFFLLLGLLIQIVIIHNTILKVATKRYGHQYFSNKSITCTWIVSFLLLDEPFWAEFCLRLEWPLLGSEPSLNLRAWSFSLIGLQSRFVTPSWRNSFQKASHFQYFHIWNVYFFLKNKIKFDDNHFLHFRSFIKLIINKTATKTAL